MHSIANKVRLFIVTRSGPFGLWGGTSLDCPTKACNMKGTERILDLCSRKRRRLFKNSVCTNLCVLGLVGSACARLPRLTS